MRRTLMRRFVATILLAAVTLTGAAGIAVGSHQVLTRADIMHKQVQLPDYGFEYTDPDTLKKMGGDEDGLSSPAFVEDEK